MEEINILFHNILSMQKAILHVDMLGSIMQFTIHNGALTFQNANSFELEE